MMQLPQIDSIHRWVEQTASDRPEAIAVIGFEQQLTYQQLDEQSNQLAHYLLAQGAGPGQLLGICLERGCAQIVALLAILKSGNAYLPLDLSYPTERLSYMLDNAQAPLLLSQTACSTALPNSSARVICLDEITTQLKRLPTTSPEAPTTANSLDSLAYVIYTSGSTGQPKGVAMAHRPLLNLLQWQRQASHAAAGSRTLQFTPISFDVSFQEIFGTLTTGGSLVLVQEDCRKNPLQLLQYLETQAVERLFLPFVALRQLAEAGAMKRLAPPDLSEVITAGEQLRITSEIAQWFSQMPGCSLHNHYGPSETHVVTALRLDGDPADWPALPSIGLPITNVEVHLLDPEQQPVAAGDVGELYFGNVCLADGYLHRPEITAERFIDNPFGLGRLYKTGDLARQLENGELEYLGRSDQQVKIRGYRIEPGEVEAQLECHPAIQEAAVIVQEEAGGDRYLAGYFLPNDSPEDVSLTGDRLSTSSGSIKLEPQALRQFLLARLPDYMVPTRFQPLSAWPLTPSGKLDRKALPGLLQPLSRVNVIPPATPTEQQVALIWQTVLHLAQVSRDDNFFELGGDSLKAIQLLYRLEQHFKQAIPLEALLAYPSLQGLSNQIEQRCSQKRLAPTTSMEVSLDPGIHPYRTAVFLTGATGHLGASLLAELLADPNLEVHCLLRGNSASEGLDRLRDTLEHQRLWQADFEGRIVPVVGDLSQARLGLDESAFQALGERISAIYHSGAWVNLAYSYTVLKQANVDSLAEILRLASFQRDLPIHFVSTVDVWVTVTGAVRPVNATTPAGPVSQLPNGYAQSKYIAEQLIDVARMRGFKVSICRPSNIIGHHLHDPQQAYSDPDSFIATMLKGCIQMGAAPEISASLNLVSADWVSQAIIMASGASSTQPSLAVNASGCTWRDAVALLNHRGFPVTLLAHEDWLAQLSALEAQGHETALTPLIAMLKAPGFLQTALGGFDFARSQTASSTSATSIAKAGEGSEGQLSALAYGDRPSSLQLLKQYCEQLIQQGDLPTPAQTSVAQQLAY